MKIGSAHRVMVRPPAPLALACAVSLFIGVEGAAAQSHDINEAVNAHGVTPTLELTPQAIHLVRREGTVTLVGLPPGEFATPIFEVVLGRITIRGSIVGGRQDQAKLASLRSTIRCY